MTTDLNGGSGAADPRPVTNRSTRGHARRGTVLANTRRAFAGACLVAGAILSQFALPQTHRPVAAALTVIIVIIWLTTRRLVGGGRLAPLEDIGFWYVSILGVYAILPLGAFLLLDLEYTPFNDYRLFSLQPTSREVARLAWLYAAYVGSFAVGYLALWRADPVPAVELRPVRRSAVVLAGLALLVIQALLLVLSLAVDLSAESYFDQYLVMQALPLGLRQLFKLVLGVRFVLLVFLMLWLMSRFRVGRWLTFLWLGAQLVMTVTSGGSRTAFMVSTAAAVILYHRFVRPLSVRMAITGGIIGVTVFLILGLMRDVQDLREGGTSIVGVRTNEFETILANAVDIQDRKARGELADARQLVAFSDLLAVVPSQLAPFPKDDVADWYMRTFYPQARDQGGGYAFGVIAQSIVGWGWIEVVLRGSVVGLLFALVNRYYRARGDRPWVVVLNVWLIVWAYESFRVTTFYMLHMFVHQFVVAFLVLEVGRRVIEGVALPAVERGRDVAPQHG